LQGIYEAKDDRCYENYREQADLKVFNESQDALASLNLRVKLQIFNGTNIKRRIEKVEFTQVKGQQTA